MKLRPSVLLALTACGGAPPDSEDWLATVSARIADGGHGFRPEETGFTAEVRERGLRGWFAGDVRLETKSDAIVLRTGESTTPSLGECVDGMSDPAGECIRRLEYVGTGTTAWWVATNDGFEQ